MNSEVMIFLLSEIAKVIFELPWKYFFKDKTIMFAVFALWSYLRSTLWTYATVFNPFMTGGLSHLSIKVCLIKLRFCFFFFFFSSSSYFYLFYFKGSRSLSYAAFSEFPTVKTLVLTNTLGPHKPSRYGTAQMGNTPIRLVTFSWGSASDQE